MAIFIFVLAKECIPCPKMHLMNFYNILWLHGMKFLCTFPHVSTSHELAYNFIPWSWNRQPTKSPLVSPTIPNPIISWTANDFTKHVIVWIMFSMKCMEYECCANGSLSHSWLQRRTDVHPWGQPRPWIQSLSVLSHETTWNLMKSIHFYCFINFHDSSQFDLPVLHAQCIYVMTRYELDKRLECRSPGDVRQCSTMSIRLAIWNG